MSHDHLKTAINVLVRRQTIIKLIANFLEGMLQALQAKYSNKMIIAEKRTLRTCSCVNAVAGPSNGMLRADSERDSRVNGLLKRKLLAAA